MSDVQEKVVNNRLQGKKIGVVLTGSFCTLSKMMKKIEALITEEGAEVYPILSEKVQKLDTKFGTAQGWRESLEDAGCQPPILTIPEAEPIGPTSFLDVILIAPCSGNTMAKLSNGITDGVALMAVKAHLRNEKPVVIGLSTNDGLSMNARNLGTLLNTKNIFFVPFGQDAPDKKPNSIVFNSDKITDTILYALVNRQLQPILSY